MKNEIIRIENLIVDYGIIRALKGINMKVNEGEIVAILGANGAGKSTLIRSISGLVKVNSGDILFEGKSIKNIESHRIAAKQIMQSPEGRLILNDLTVEENLLVGAYSLKKMVTKNENDKNTVVSKKQRTRKLLDEVYDYFPILKERRKQQASTLSGGEQQMLAIGRALMGDPKVLLLDEPSLGLAPLIVEKIFEILSVIKKTGRTIIIVEQNAFMTLRIADYAYVLELGRIKLEDQAKNLLKNDELIHAYLGGK